MPKVSVIIPAYNHSAFIAAAIDSVLAQSFRDFEIIVVNDGSPDATEEVLRPYIESGKIHYIWQENLGPAAARNRGVEAAEGEFIAFLDDDDQWLPDKLEWQLACFEEADVVMVAGTSLLQGAPNKQRWRLRRQAFDVLRLVDFFRGNPVGSPGQVLLRKSDLTRLGGFDVSIWGADDLDLWIRLSQLGEIRRYPRPCLLYRQHASNASMDFRRMGINTLKVISRHIDASTGQSQMRHRIHAYRFLFRYTGRKLLWEAARHWREGRRKEARYALKEVHRVFRSAILRDPKLAFSVLHAAIKTPWKLHKYRNSDYRRHGVSQLEDAKPHHPIESASFDSPHLPLAPSPRLVECLKEGGRMVYLPNPGNLGDEMIAAATTMLFAKLGVRYEIFDENAEYGEGWTLIYGGGGACVPYWNILDKLKVIFTMHGIGRCIILPHSIRDCPDLLSVMDSRFTVFCHEQASFDYCRSKNQQAEFVLSDDMALSLDLNHFPSISATERRVSIVSPPLASIIIPFYNGGKWLPQIKRQVNQQTWNNIEVILINDGSTNISKEEIEDYFKDDKKYRVVHKKNNGAGSARNSGLKLAQGKYIFFYDIDDFLAPSLVEECITNAEFYNSDVVIFEYSTVNDSGIPINRNKSKYNKYIKNKEKSIFDLASINYLFDFSPNCWNKCYNLNFLIENKIDFSTTRSSNDFKFSVCALFAAQKIYFLKKNLYGYRFHNDDNITSNLSYTSSDCLLALGEIFEFIEARGLLDNQIIKKRLYKFSRSVLFFNLKHDIILSNALCFAENFNKLNCLKPIFPIRLSRDKNLQSRIWLFHALTILTYGKKRKKFCKKYENLLTIQTNLKKILELM